MTVQQMLIVPHTHWDREWYEPHDVFRVRLVAMIDQLLELLETQPRYRFTLDGQAAAFDDYLELRPENRGRLAALVERGQLAVGPFLILLDEFCCDGETIIRNLELGIRASRRLGAAMPVGYLPDMFGHAAQMPQILTGFGIRDAALWRGVPDAVRHHAFRWTAPNGDSVRTEYLWDGYGSALKLFEPAEKLTEQLADYLEQNSSWFGGEPVAGMYGTDHMAPRPDLLELLDRHNAGDPVQLEMATMGDVVCGRDHSAPALAGLPEVVGELRSHARGNLLPGVLSIRTNLKAAMAEAERALTTTERLDASRDGLDSASFLDLAWYRLVESTAHDSVTGCGIDATAEEVGTRIHVAGHIARGVSQELLRVLAADTPAGSVVVFNPSGYARRLLVELFVAGVPVDGPSLQVLEAMPTTIGDETLLVADLARIIRRIHGQELFGKQIVSYAWTDHCLDFLVADHADGGFELSTFTAELSERMAAHEENPRPWRIRTLVPASTRVLASVLTPGLGISVVNAEESDAPQYSVSATDESVSNGLISVTVNPDGTTDVTDPATGRTITGALRLVDEGDRGDSYNFAPTPGQLVNRPAQVTVTVLERGALRGRILIARTYDLPAGLDPGDRTCRGAMLAQRVDTVLELRADEPFVRVQVSLVNGVADHRLRIHVPTFEDGVQESASAGQYGVTTRGRAAEGGWGEFPLPTFPATRFIHAGGVGVLLRKLTEFEVVDGGAGQPDAIALTLVRSVGLMSVNTHPLRDEPAGSQIPVPGAQYLGTEVVNEFAIGLGWTGWTESDIAREADLFRLEPLTMGGTADAARIVSPTAGSLIQTGGDVTLESLRRVEAESGQNTLEARFVNYYPEERPLAAALQGSWDVTDLAGTVLSERADTDALTVPGGGILTLRQRR